MAAIHIVNLHRLHSGRKIKTYRKRKGFGDLSEEQIVDRYRLDRETILYLVNLLHDDLKAYSNRGLPLDPFNQVLVTLRFLAKGDFYSEIADCQGLSRSTVCRVIHRTVDAINARLDNINFPADEHALRASKLAFFRTSGIPNIIGAIDGTLVPIIAPKEDEHAYLCRKGFHAVNVQSVVDQNLRFIDVVARWPGSAHDASIFDSCGLKVHLESNNIGCLLGDSAYPLRQYLLTPLLTTNNRQQEKFNKAHSRGRIVVEKAFGLLKSRFRCLHKTGGCMMLSPGRGCNIVCACMRLHNLCVERNVPAVREDVVEEQEDDAVDQPASGSAVDWRNTIIRTF